MLHRTLLFASRKDAMNGTRVGPHAAAALREERGQDTARRSAVAMPDERLPILNRLMVMVQITASRSPPAVTRTRARRMRRSTVFVCAQGDLEPDSPAVGMVAYSPMLCPLADHVSSPAAAFTSGCRVQGSAGVEHLDKQHVRAVQSDTDRAPPRRRRQR
jgi:hypothetical protein